MRRIVHSEEKTVNREPFTLNQPFASTQGKRRSRLGFSLIELLVVIAIIGILSAVGIMLFGSAQKKARDGQRKSDLAQVKKALISARSDCTAAAYYPSVDTTTVSKEHFDTLSTSLAAGTSKYVKIKIQDPKATSPIASSTYGYEFFPVTNTSGACASFTGNYGTDQFLLKTKLESANDPDSKNSYTGCSGMTGLEATNDGLYFYICGK